MPHRKFYFYHFNQKSPIYNKDYSSVWLPLSAEAETMIEHIKSKLPLAEIKIEEPLYTYFKTKQNPTANLTNYKKNIILYAQSDTLANSAAIVGNNLQQHQITYVVPKIKGEKADEFFTSKNISFSRYSFSLLKSIKPDIFLLLNDWGKEAQRIIAHCHLLKIPVICLQESVIDFGDHHKRMQRADNVFVQGSQTVIDLIRNNYYITGNPRYEILKPATEKGEHVLINCNFTYGIFEEIRTSWLDDIHDILSQHQQDYAISQHPRDSGNLVKYKKVIPSSSASVDEQLSKTTFLITRFSSLIHEALVMGVPVIYYNPHGETMQYDFEFDGKMLQLAKNKTELESCVNNLKNYTVNTSYLHNYLARHCICKSSLPTKNISDILSNVAFKPVNANLNDYVKIILYHPSIKRVLSKIRKTLFKKQS